MLVCPDIPFALPRDRIRTRPVAHTFAQPVARMLATLVFRFSRFSAYLLNTRALRAARIHIPPARSRVVRTFIAMFPHAL